MQGSSLVTVEVSKSDTGLDDQSIISSLRHSFTNDDQRIKHLLLSSGTSSVEINIPNSLTRHATRILLTLNQPPLLPNATLYWEFFVYQLYTHDCVDLAKMEDTNNEGDNDTQQSQQHGPSSTIWCLPHVGLEHLWESLVFEDKQMKDDLLRYVSTTLMFTDHGVNPNRISCNRTCLFHGPPGTGKTSISHALAQKLSIRFKDRFNSTRLIEINAQSLFSKYFSESGKLVAQLFHSLFNLASDPAMLLILQIDEVESIASSRSSRGCDEPSDAIRTVNALLTHIDRLASLPNVLILCTSNVTGRIDMAFVDRADLKIHVGLPPLEARYQILLECLRELQARGLVDDSDPVISFQDLQEFMHQDVSITKIGQSLLKVAEISEGVSGRGLKKLPVLAFAFHCPSSSSFTHPITATMFTQMMIQAATQHQKETKKCWS